MTTMRIALIAALAIAGGIACKATPAASPAATGAAPPASAAYASTPSAAVATSVGAVTGTAAETINSGGYTYVRLQTGQKEIWIAASEQPVKTGERLSVALEMPMQNFHSKTLNRDFPLIYFVSDLGREREAAAVSAAPALAGSHGAAAGTAAGGTAPHVVETLAPPRGGLSVADVYAKRAALAGKTVVFRGKVVKANSAIMGKNWFHVQDGSGSADAGTNDLTVTTAATVDIGDIVTVSGTLAVKQDFGAGYQYEVMVENATVTVSTRASAASGDQSHVLRRGGKRGARGLEAERNDLEVAANQ